MTNVLRSPTRRAFGAMVVSVPLIAGTAGIGAASPIDRRLSERLQMISMPYQPAELSLVRLTQNMRSSSFELDAVIRLTWSPGLRQRRFIAAGVDEDRALDRILADLETYLHDLV